MNIYMCQYCQKYCGEDQEVIKNCHSTKEKGEVKQDASTNFQNVSNKQRHVLTKSYPRNQKGP